MTGWHIDPGRHERNLLIGAACVAGALIGAALVWVWDTLVFHLHSTAPAVRPKGARGS